MQHRIRTLRVRTIFWLAALAAILAMPGTATAQSAGAPEAAVPAPSPRLLAEASWHGRPIQRPFARRSDVSDRGASLRPGTGYSRPGGSRRVRDVQRRLLKLGYRPGSADGLFGPRTQAAVLAFQRKHGLQRTGTVGSGTLRILRRRTAPQAEPPAPAERPEQTQSQPRQTQPQPRQTQRQPPVTPVQATDDGFQTLAVVLLLALAIPLVLLAGLLLRGQRRVALDAPPEPPALPPADPQSDLQSRWIAAPPRRAEEVERPEPPPPEPLPPEPREEPRVRRVPPPRHAPSEERRQALRERILAMRAEGMTLQEIADQLTEEGEPTPGGGKTWQTWTVRAATRPVRPPDRETAQHRRRRPK